MSQTTVALALHVLAATVWVGGMFAAYLCLRPATGLLDGPQRLQLWRNFFAKFFPWVWGAVLVLIGSGYWMLIANFGGFKGAPLYINLMQALGLLMALLFVRLYHDPWLKFRRAVDAKDWSGAALHLGRIARVIQINLPLGLIVVVIGGTGRLWG